MLWSCMEFISIYDNILDENSMGELIEEGSEHRKLENRNSIVKIVISDISEMKDLGIGL